MSTGGVVPRVAGAGSVVQLVADAGCVVPRVADAGCVVPRVADAAGVVPRVAAGGVTSHVVAVDGVCQLAEVASGVENVRAAAASRRRRDDGNGGLGGAVDGVAHATEPALDSGENSGLSTSVGTDMVLGEEALGRAACLDAGWSGEGGSGSPQDGGVSNVKPACGPAAPGSAR